MLGDAGAGAATGIGPRERGRDRRGALSREAVSLDLRLDPRVLEVLNAIAARHEVALDDLVQGIVLHAFEGRTPFGPYTRAFIADKRRASGLALTSEDCRRPFAESDG